MTMFDDINATADRRIAENAREEERAAVVKYLRRMSKSEVLPWGAEQALSRHADAIEKGEHL